MGMNDINSLSHTKWNCKYHIVFAPKYRRKVFAFGEGIVEGDYEQTIRNFGRLAKEGMKDTDIEILNIMIGK